MQTEVALNPFCALSVWFERAPQQTFVIEYDVNRSRETGSLSGRSSSTVAQVWEQVVAAAAGLSRSGVGHGDVVAIQLPNWSEYLVAHLAALALGATTVPISPILANRDVERQLELSAATALIAPGRFGNRDFVDLVRGVRDRIGALKTIVVVRDDRMLGYDEVHWDALMDLGRNPDLASRRASIAAGQHLHSDSQAILVNYTSGSTGDPKGVMHNVVSATAHVEPLCTLLGLSGADVLLVPTSLGHAAGFLNGMYIPLYLGAAVVYMDRWDAGLAMEIVEAEGVTYGPAMPTYLADILAHPRFASYDLHTWTAARVSGGPITRTVVERLRVHLPTLRLFPGWGMTEALLLTSCGPGDPEEKLLHTDGRPLADTILSVRDPSLTTTVPVGEVGEIMVKSASIMQGYLGQPELTASVFHAGWLHSGDLGRVDAEGYLTITGRSKDIIVRGGENVPMLAVEESVNQHALVTRACVVGVPDDRLGEKVCAVVQTDGSELTLQVLSTFLMEIGVTRQFIPEYLVVVDEFPTTSVGKPQRSRLKEIAIERLGMTETTTK